MELLITLHNKMITTGPWHFNIKSEIFKTKKMRALCQKKEKHKQLKRMSPISTQRGMLVNWQIWGKRTIFKSWIRSDSRVLFCTSISLMICKRHVDIAKVIQTLTNLKAGCHPPHKDSMIAMGHFNQFNSIRAILHIFRRSVYKKNVLDAVNSRFLYQGLQLQCQKIKEESVVLTARISVPNKTKGGNIHLIFFFFFKVSLTCSPLGSSSS